MNKSIMVIRRATSLDDGVCPCVFVRDLLHPKRLQSKIEALWGAKVGEADAMIRVAKSSTSVEGAEHMLARLVETRRQFVRKWPPRELVTQLLNFGNAYRAVFVPNACEWLHARCAAMGEDAVTDVILEGAQVGYWQVPPFCLFLWGAERMAGCTPGSGPRIRAVCHQDRLQFQ